MLARVVRKRKGTVQRAILFVRSGEAKPLMSAVAGTRYSVKEHLEHGQAWDLKHLGGNCPDTTYAPDELRDDFLRVVTECSVTGCSRSA